MFCCVGLSDVASQVAALLAQSGLAPVPSKYCQLTPAPCSSQVKSVQGNSVLVGGCESLLTQLAGFWTWLHEADQRDTSPKCDERLQPLFVSNIWSFKPKCWA